MPICPKCGKEIDYLHGYKEHKYTLRIINGEMTETSVENELSFQVECPNCSEALFEDWEEAEAFLNGC